MLAEAVDAHIGVLQRGDRTDSQRATMEIVSPSDKCAPFAEGIRLIEQGIRDFRGTGGVLGLPGYLALKAEALHLAHRTSEALEALNEAEALAERFDHSHVLFQLHWLRGSFLMAMGADDPQIAASFCEAIRIAKQRKAASLTKCAEATYSEYRSQKGRPLGWRGSRLPLP